MPCHDVQCSKCGLIIENYYASPWPSSISHDDGGELEILWRDSHSRPAAAHPLDRTVIWKDPITGEISYPPTNTAAMPLRYRQRGFQRIEFEHAHEVEQFEREQGVINEKLWFNSGNGVN
jgi:hypothetical protein